MFTLLKLAFRNIFRFKRRTFITFCSVSVGLALLIITICLMNGIDKQSISNIINCQTSHLKIFKKGYFEQRDNLPMDLTINKPGDIHELLKDVPGVVASESRIIFGTGLIKGMDELPCLGVAIQPDVDPDLFNIKESITDGEWLEPGEEKIMVGKDLAKDMDLTVGDIVTVRMITSSDPDKFSWNAVDLEVKGIFESGNPTVDKGRIIIPLTQAMASLGMENQVTEIVVRLQNDEDETITAAQNQINKLLNSGIETFEVVTWKDLAGTFLAISEMKTQRSGMIIMIMLIIASMGIINTMMMAVFERTREIGMLAAMGMKKNEIMRLFIFEGGLIGAIGALLGCLLGGLTTWYLEVKGWSINAFGETLKKLSEASYPIKDVYYADLTLDVLVMTFLFGVAISILASTYPAWKAAKLNPTEALRNI